MGPKRIQNLRLILRSPEKFVILELDEDLYGFSSNALKLIDGRRESETPTVRRVATLSLSLSLPSLPSLSERQNQSGAKETERVESETSCDE